MNKMYFLGCMGILAASAMLSSCSSDNDDPTPSPNPGSEVVYKWTTNGGLKLATTSSSEQMTRKTPTEHRLATATRNSFSQASRL